MVLDLIVPGAGRVAHFLIKLIPEVLTFITTQFMLIWSRKKADEEGQAQQFAAGQNANSAKMLKKINAQLKQLSSGVKPFKNQLANIPGLQTAWSQLNGKKGLKNAT